MTDIPSVVTEEQLLLPKTGVSLAEKVECAVEAIRFYEHIALFHDAQGYHLCYSGGKDSGVILELARMAGVAFTAHYNVTTIDAPELARFVRQVHPEVTWDRPKRPFFSVLPLKGLPTRRARWCCELYKEGGGKGKVKMMGIRAAESASRKDRAQVFSRWTRRAEWVLCPIIWWSERDVWEFMRERDLPYCCLYDEGFKRLGCVGCPSAREKGRRREFARWPRFERLWRKAAQALWDRRAGTMQRDGVTEWLFSAKFANAHEMFEWWLSDRALPGEPETEESDCWLGLW